MARMDSSSKSLTFLIIMVSSIVLLIHTGHAYTYQNEPASAPSPFTISQELDIPGCVQSVTGASVCITDFWTHLGQPPSAACCTALEKIEQECWSALFPQFGPLTPLIKILCSGGGGGGGGGGGAPPSPFPFPFPSFPFPPFPFPPFPFPPFLGGGGVGGSGGSGGSGSGVSGAPPPNKA